MIYLASSFLVDPRARSQRGLWSFGLRISRFQVSGPKDHWLT